jgi:acetyl esterase
VSGQSNSETLTVLREQPTLDAVVQAFLQQRARDGEKSPHDLDTARARQSFDRLQSDFGSLISAEIEDLVLKVGPTGEVGVRIVRPAKTEDLYPIIFYLHGGAWVAGNAVIYDRLLRDLAHGVNAAVVFIDFTLAPEVTCPTQNEQAYAAFCEVVRNSKALKLDNTRIALVGDCSGGNMAAVLTLLAKRRRGPEIAFQVLLYPIVATLETLPVTSIPREKLWLTTDALDTRLVVAFPDAMSWKDVTSFPLNANILQLNDLPKALIVVAEHDIVRDGAEEYARHLTEAGVIVTCTRYNGAIHDFMLLNALSESSTARSAWAQVIDALNAALYES